MVSAVQADPKNEGALLELPDPDEVEEDELYTDD